jgi:hypothetical protein
MELLVLAETVRTYIRHTELGEQRFLPPHAGLVLGPFIRQPHLGLLIPAPLQLGPVGLPENPL